MTSGRPDDPHHVEAVGTVRTVGGAGSADEESPSPRQIAVLGLLSAAGPLAMDFYLASLPQVQRSLDTNSTAVQLTLTVFLLGLGLGQFFWGPVGDRYGRLRPLLAGALVSVAAAGVCVVAPTIQVLVAARFVQALAASAGPVTARAIIADRLTGPAAAGAMSLMMSVNSIAPVVAPLIGGLLAGHVSWRWVLAVVLLAMVAQFVGALTTIRESLPPSRRTASLRLTHPGRPLRGRAFVGYALTSIFAFASMMAYISASSFVYQRVIGASPTLYGIGFALTAAGMIAAGLTAARLSRRGLPPELAVRRAMHVLVAGSLGVLVIALIAPPLLLTFAFFVVETAMGFIMGNTAALALAQAREAAGRASAIVGGGNFLLGAAVSSLGGLADNGTAVPLGITMSCCALAATISLRSTRLS